jgi:plastocyanin
LKPTKGVAVTRIALAAAAAASLAFAAAAQASTPVLKGEVGPGFTIEVKQGGKDVKSLKAGTYKLVVQDKASIHNFHLTGPGLNKSTSIEGTGEQTWTVKLKKGTYKYQCDPHASSMNGSFKVTG